MDRAVKKGYKDFKQIKDLYESLLRDHTEETTLSVVVPKLKELKVQVESGNLYKAGNKAKNKLMALMSEPTIYKGVKLNYYGVDAKFKGTSDEYAQTQHKLYCDRFKKDNKDLFTLVAKCERKGFKYLSDLHESICYVIEAYTARQQEIKLRRSEILQARREGFDTPEAKQAWEGFCKLEKEREQQKDLQPATKDTEALKQTLEELKARRREIADEMTNLPFLNNGKDPSVVRAELNQEYADIDKKIAKVMEELAEPVSEQYGG